MTEAINHAAAPDAVKEKCAMGQTMKQLNRQSMRQLAAAFGLISILAIAPAGFAQQSVQGQSKMTSGGSQVVASAHAPNNASSEQDEAQGSAKPGGEGIKVHGHWVLEVKGKDGKTVERREFNNSLVGFGANTSGDQVLAALLTGTATAGDLAVAFISGDTTGVDTSTLCEGNRGATPICFMLIANNSTLATGLNSALQSGLHETVYFSPSVKIVLSGNFTVPAAMGAAGIVSVVQTYAGLCGVPGTNGFMQSISGQINTFQQSSVAPAGCNYTAVTPGGGMPNTPIAMGAFTSTVVGGGLLAVTTGQVITVTVTITFS